MKILYTILNTVGLAFVIIWKPEINHSAQVINPIKIFDRFGADLVLGLTLTEEGYNGILLITEYLTKFPHGFPIKTKTAQEIAERLFEYIALFGPSDLMLSDMGEEFVAQVVQQLCENCGIQSSNKWFN